MSQTKKPEGLGRWLHVYLDNELFESMSVCGKEQMVERKHGAENRNKTLRDRERAVSGSGRYYRKRVGGCVRTTFLFSQNTGIKCCLLSLSSFSKELGRRHIFNAIRTPLNTASEHIAFCHKYTTMAQHSGMLSSQQNIHSAVIVCLTAINPQSPCKFHSCTLTYQCCRSSKINPRAELFLFCFLRK